MQVAGGCALCCNLQQSAAVWLVLRHAAMHAAWCYSTKLSLSGTAFDNERHAYLFGVHGTQNLHSEAAPHLQLQHFFHMEGMPTFGETPISCSIGLEMLPKQQK
mmetsp:Transcript_90491/g.174194  ORF Transcript_90491/g.174194 Transcript_90491/m.174194 type:complete len:104 (-) Transcript_90491:2-313(-)